MTRSSTIRVALYSDADRWGGAEHGASLLLRSLGEHVTASVIGTDPAIVAKLAGSRPTTSAHVCRPVRDKWDAAGIVDHLRTVHAVAPDILHVNLRTPWSCQYGILAGLVFPHVAVVVTENTPPIPSTPFQRRLKRWTSSRVHGHVACSSAAARAVERAARLPARSIGTIYNGVEPVIPPLERPGDRRVIGSVGRLVPEKGFDILVTAVARIPDARLRIVGDGPDRSSLQCLVERLGVGDRVEICGWSDDLGAELAGFDVFAAPSRVEGLGIAAIEAMLSGLPVVAARTGGLLEVVDDEATGLLVQPEDPAALAGALRRVLDDPPERAAMGERAHTLATARFSPAAAARAVERVYDEALLARR